MGVTPSIECGVVGLNAHVVVVNGLTMMGLVAWYLARGCGAMACNTIISMLDGHQAFGPTWDVVTDLCVVVLLSVLNLVLNRDAMVVPFAASWH